MDLIQDIAQAYLFGFGLFTILRLIASPLFSKEFKSQLLYFDNFACILVPWIALFFIALFAIEVWFNLQIINNVRALHEYKERAFGFGWLPFWHQTIIYLLACLLWIKKMRRMNWFRIVLAIFMMLSIHWLIMFLTSFERDYLPAGWSFSISSILTNWFIALSCFIGITLLVLFASQTMKKVGNK